MHEQRHFHRIRFDVKAELEVSGTVTETSLVDISLKGALIECPPGFTPVLGTHCRLTIHLNGSDLFFSLDGDIVHVNDRLAGVRITLIDIDSMIHLRRLVTLNSEDSEQVRSELNALFGFGDEDSGDDAAGGRSS
jgi:hypothetical protein